MKIKVFSHRKIGSEFFDTTIRAMEVRMDHEVEAVFGLEFQPEGTGDSFRKTMTFKNIEASDMWVDMITQKLKEAINIQRLPSNREFTI